MGKIDKLREKAQAFSDKGRDDKALSLYRDGCKKDPYDVDLWTGRAELALKLGEKSEALEAFFHAADMYARGGFPKEGLSICQRVLAIDPGHGGARRLTNMLRSKLGMDEAPVDPLASTPSNPDLPRKFSNVGKVPSLPASERGQTSGRIEMTMTADEAPMPATKSNPDIPRKFTHSGKVPSLPPGERGQTSGRVELTMTADEPDLPPAATAAPAPPSSSDISEALERAAESQPPRKPEVKPATPPAAKPRLPSTPPPTPAAAKSAAPTPAVAKPAAPPTAAAKPTAPPTPAAAKPAAPPTPAVKPSAPPTPAAPRTPTPVSSPAATPSDPGLDDISLSEALPSHEVPLEPSMREIPLDDAPGELDVLQVVAASITTSPLLNELDSDLVKQLINQGELVHRKKTQTVFKQGQIGSSLFLILRGEVAVVREGSGPTGAPIELARLRAGAFFGEMALLTNRPRSASVVAEADCDLLEVSRHHVRELVAREGRILKLLMRFFRARMVSTLLATSTLFKPFGREDRRQLVGRFRLREVAADRDVIKEGTRSDGLYLVLTGKLHALRAGREMLGELGPGDVFGEMSLLTKAPAVASVRTQSKAWLLMLPREDFAEVLSTHPQLLEKLTEVADERKRQNEQHFPADRLNPV